MYNGLEERIEVELTNYGYKCFAEETESGIKMLVKYGNHTLRKDIALVNWG